MPERAVMYNRTVPRYLSNDDGQPFDAGELAAISADLDKLSLTEREIFRNKNATHIANHHSPKMLVVSAPGTGKSTLFKQKIVHWLSTRPTARILALSFVRKLVADLDSDIQTDRDLTSEQKKQAETYTLHKYARSIVEKNHGTSARPLRPHFKIIGESWKDVVWNDTLSMSLLEQEDGYTWKEFEKQLHTRVFETSKEWHRATEDYSMLCTFYNAVGFGDLIIRAERALTENPELNEHDYFIIDEYQDFNQAEEDLIKTLSKKSEGVLMVGDDDQVLYEKLKSGEASLIRNLYKDNSYTNGMLPFCGRCGFYIVEAAQHFIAQSLDPKHIEKIYLPMKEATSSEKINAVACAKPATAVEYIRKFIEEHQAEIIKRKELIESGKSKDAYLLILTPAKIRKMYGETAEELESVIQQYKSDDAKFSNDYYKVLTYYSLARNTDDNFSLRKVLHYERVAPERVVEFIVAALDKDIPLSQVNASVIKESLRKAESIKKILDSEATPPEKVASLSAYLSVENSEKLESEITLRPIGIRAEYESQIEEEEDAELEEIGIKKMSAVELMTILGSKGLSADHVIILGFDNVNMSLISRNAFYVAMTRARIGLHLITALGARGAKGAHKYLSQLPEPHIEYSSFKKGGRVLERLGSVAKFVDYFKRNVVARSLSPKANSKTKK